MSLGVWISILSAAATALSLLVAFVAFQYSRRKTEETEQAGETRQLIAIETASLRTQVEKLDRSLADAVADVYRLANDAQESKVAASRLAERITVLETKVDVFWKKVAYDAASILHSPHTPELDRLLEAFQAGTLSPEDSAELIRRLEVIVSSREASSAGARVAAMIILRVLE